MAVTLRKVVIGYDCLAVVFMPLGKFRKSVRYLWVNWSDCSDVVWKSGRITNQKAFSSGSQSFWAASEIVLPPRLTKLRLTNHQIGKLR